MHAGSFAKQLWVIVPETAAKLGYGWRPAAVARHFRRTVQASPDCGKPVQDRERKLCSESATCPGGSSAVLQLWGLLHQQLGLDTSKNWRMLMELADQLGWSEEDVEAEV